MTSLQTMNRSDGTIKLIELITQWFKMMSVKLKYLATRFNDDYRGKWSNDCDCFNRLATICKVVLTCIFNGVRGRQKMLTTHTGNAFLVTTANNVLAAKMLLNTYKFEYVLSAVFSQNPLEKFFGQTRQRCGGNFYIDIGDVIAAAKAQHLHQLLKFEIIPEGETCIVDCVLCHSVADVCDLEIIDEISVKDTEILIESNDTVKQKVVYLGGFLAHKLNQPDVDISEDVTCDFLNELNRGRLHVPTLTTVYFVHSSIHLYEKLDDSTKHCAEYFRNLLSHIDAPLSENNAACRTLSNLVFKARVIAASDRENVLGCLRRKEKLAEK